MIDELTNYLGQEAARVRIDDRLADIEAGVALIPTRRQHRRPRWMTPALIGAAAAAIALIGVTASSRPSPGPVASLDGQRTNAVSSPSDATVPVAIVAPAAPLPEGATMQGFTPMCTTADGIEFDCTVDGYRHAGGNDDHGIDHKGEVQAVITAGSIVNGGCRSTSADGSTWHCALGQRAVDLDMIGADYLGQSESPGYAAG
jgi:hypothetical protein